MLCKLTACPSLYLCVSPDITNSNCINVNYTWRGGCPDKIEVHNTDCQRLCEIYRHFILLLLHNCPKCNAVFFSSNKTAPIGGHRQAGCWFGRSHCPLLTVIRICRLCGKMPNSWNDTDDFRKHLKHWDFMIDNRCCTKCISNKCRQRGAGQRENVRRVVRWKKKIDRLKYMVIILSSLTVTFPPDKALAFKIFIRVLTKEMARKFLLH